MSKKVFLVTDGEYSDYGVCAVFSNKEKADEFARLGNYERVEEYPLDMEFKDPGYDTYQVYMEVVEGTVESVVKLPRIDRDGLPIKGCTLRSWKDTHPTCQTYREGLEGKSTMSRLIWSGKAKSEEHARRHVTELRRQILAGQRPEEVDMGKK